jgi:hypothetical protein
VASDDCPRLSALVISMHYQPDALIKGAAIVQLKNFNVNINVRLSEGSCFLDVAGTAQPHCIAPTGLNRPQPGILVYGRKAEFGDQFACLEFSLGC